MLDSMVLPAVTTDSMMCSRAEEKEKCEVGGDEICSTILSVLHSSSRVGLVVHIVDSHGPSPEVLIRSTKAAGSPTCVVLSMGNPRIRNGANNISLHTDDNPEGVEMDEGRAIHTIVSIKRACDCLVWYWTLDGLGYATVFNQDDNVRWVVTLFPDTQPDTPLYGIGPHGSSTSNTIRVLPFFYTTPSSPTIAVMGRGFSTHMCGDDLKVELLALSRLSINRVYRSRASTGRCFCCQYLINIHDKLHVHEGHKENHSISLRLEPSFRQRMCK